MKTFIQKNILIILVFVAAAFLRLYRLDEFAIFLSDQGRDAIIIKRIITLEHLPAIGAPSSVGQVYLGPFYYYLIAPFLLLFNFNPLGLAFGVAFLSLIGILISYLIVKKELGKTVSFLFLVFISFFFINIESSRFSWNPNLLPFFSFLTLYFFYKIISSNNPKSNKLIYSVLFGAFFSFSLQLHYLAVFLIFPILIFTLLNFFKNFENKKLLISKFLNFLISFISFAFFSLPLLIFDLRHNFLNSKNFLQLFNQQISSGGSFLIRFQETTGSFFSNITIKTLSPQIGIWLFVCLFFIYIYFLRKKQINSFLHINLVNIFTYLVGFSFLTGSRHPHYYHSVYLSFFLVVSYMLANLLKKSKSAGFFIFLFIIFYLVLNLKNTSFLFQKPNNQIDHARKIAEFLAEKIDNKPFNIATWPVEFFEDAYLYFLELKGLIPANRSKIQITDQMFVLCNKEPCQIINSPSWNISMFGKAKIDKIWTIDGIKIYKLVHEK